MDHSMLVSILLYNASLNPLLVLHYSMEEVVIHNEHFKHSVYIYWVCTIAHVFWNKIQSNWNNNSCTII